MSITENRKLAAIVVTDITDFSSIAGKDEKKAIALIDKQKELIIPLLEKFNGIIHKEIGDGLLLTFQTVSGALQFSINIQKKSKDIKDLNLRIGIHEGEITIYGDDILGDDVNIASRIEVFAAKGGIVISGKVQQNILSLPEYKTKYIGKPKLKGISQDVKIYCIVSHNLPKTNTSKVFAKIEKESKKFNIFTLTGFILTTIGIAFWIYTSFFDFSYANINREDVPSIGVLMMDSEDSIDNKFWANGLTDELITKIKNSGLIRVSSTKEISKIDTSNHYKKIANDLDTKYLFVSNIDKEDKNFNIYCQLIDSHSGKVIYENNWNDNVDNVLNIISEISYNVLNAIDLKVAKSTNKIETKNSKAYEYYLKGRELWDSRGSEEAEIYFKKAMNLDSSFIAPMLNLAYIYGYTNREEESQKMNLDALRIAKENNDSLSIGYSLSAIGFNKLFDKSGKIYIKDSIKYFESGIEYQMKALQIANNIDNNELIKKVYQNLGIAYNWSGQYLKSIEYYKKTLELADLLDNDLNRVNLYMMVGDAYMGLHDYFNARKHYMIGGNIMEGSGHTRILQSYFPASDFKSALKYYKTYFSKEDLFLYHPQQQSTISMMCGEIYFGLEDFEIAYKEYTKSISIILDNEIEWMMPSTHIPYSLLKKELSAKYIGIDYNVDLVRSELNNINGKIDYTSNYYMYLLSGEDKYIKEAYNQINKELSKIEGIKRKNRFKSYPIPKKIMYEYKKSIR